MTVDVMPFQAMEIAASSPRDLPRFLIGLDDAVLESVRHVAELVLRGADAEQASRRFRTLWLECGSRQPAWPTDTAALLAETVAAAAETIHAEAPVPSVPAPAPPPSAEIAADATQFLTTATATATAVAVAGPDVLDVPGVPDLEEIPQ